MKNKKDIIYITIIVLLIGLAGQFYYSYQLLPASETKAYYSYDHELNKQVIDLIRDADKFVYFGVYTFTRQDIADALLAAKYRGLTVVGITDRDQYNSLDAQKKIINSLRQDGIPVYEQDHAGIMHMKAVVTDKAYASGSYNWTAAATNLNDEVLEIGTNPRVRQDYQNILEEVFKKYGG